MPDPVTAGEKIKEMHRRLQAGGMPSSAKIFGAGHSLGGVVIQQELLNRDGIPWAGAILMGSFLTRGNNQNWTLPLLQIGGELDGLARVFRMAEAFAKQFKAHYNEKD